MNLLPLEEQQKIRNERLIRLFEVSGVGLFFLISGAVILLASAYTYLQIQASGLEHRLVIERQSTELRRVESLDLLIKDLNAQARFIIDNEKLIHNPLLEIGNILDVKPVGIYILHIDYDHSKDKDAIITIRGQANTRANLLRYIDALEGSGNFASIGSPVSNLLSREGAEFSLSIVLRSAI